MRRRSSNGLRGRLLRSRREKVSKGDELLREYTRRIAERYPESAIILFGSRAKGRPLPYSDYDVLVVLKNVNDKLSAIEGLRRLKPRGLPLDLLVISAGELNDPLISAMLKGSKVLYNGLGLEIAP